MSNGLHSNAPLLNHNLTNINSTESFETQHRVLHSIPDPNGSIPFVQDIDEKIYQSAATWWGGGAEDAPWWTKAPWWINCLRVGSLIDDNVWSTVCLVIARHSNSKSDGRWQQLFLRDTKKADDKVGSVIRLVESQETMPPNETLLNRGSSQEFGSESRQKCLKRRLLPALSALLLGGVIAIVVIALGKSSNSEKKSSSEVNKPSSNKTDNIFPSSPSQRLVAFWQSEVTGCEKVPEGVTHVAFGFALTSSGRIDPTFQAEDSIIKNCVKALHKKQIYAMGSIGGSTNNANFSDVTDAQLFALDALQLTQKFSFDGIDIDYEGVGSQFNKAQVIDIMRATREKLHGYLLAYDSYFYEADATRCTDQYSRCFPQEIIPFVDWVNVMAYNVNQDAAAAAHVYESAINTTFADWTKVLNNEHTKQTTGICIGSSCAYGPGPSDQVIASWAEYAKSRGGLMIYAASSEVEDNFPVTRRLIKLLSAK